MSKELQRNCVLIKQFKNLRHSAYNFNYLRKIIFNIYLQKNALALAK